MNQREYARPSIRVRNWLLLVVGVCMMSSLGGCAVWQETGRVFALAKRTTHVEPHYFEYIQSDRLAQREARLLAEQAWAESANAGSASPDFENGYHEGFADYLYRGGSGEPPIIPPRGYWHLRFLNQFGKTTINDWYAGFRAGAADCKARGLRDMWLIPTSLIADPKPSSTPAAWTDEETWNKETYQRRVEQRNQEKRDDLESLQDPDEPPSPDMGGDPYGPSDMPTGDGSESDPDDEDPTSDLLGTAPDDSGADMGSDDFGFGADTPEDDGDQQATSPFDLQPEPSDSSDSELRMREGESSGSSYDDLFGDDSLPETDPIEDDLDVPLDSDLPDGGDPPTDSSNDGFGMDDLGMIRFKGSRSAKNDRQTANQRVRHDSAVRQTSGTGRPSQVKPGNRLRTRRSGASAGSRSTTQQSSGQPRPYVNQATRSNRTNNRASVPRVATRQSVTSQPARRAPSQPVLKQSAPPALPATQRAAPQSPTIEITAADLLFDDDSDGPPAPTNLSTKKQVARGLGTESLPTLPLHVEKPRPSDFMQWDPMEGIEEKPAFEDLDAKFETVMSDEAIEQSTEWTAEMSRATELPLRVADMRMQTVERPTFGKSVARPKPQTAAKEKSGGLMDQLRMALKSSSKTSSARSQSGNQVIIRDYDRKFNRAEPNELPPIVDLPDVIDRGAVPQTTTSGNAIQFRIRD